MIVELKWGRLHVITWEIMRNHPVKLRLPSSTKIGKPSRVEMIWLFSSIVFILTASFVSRLCSFSFLISLFLSDPASFRCSWGSLSSNVSASPKFVCSSSISKLFKTENCRFHWFWFTDSVSLDLCRFSMKTVNSKFLSVYQFVIVHGIF